MFNWKRSFVREKQKEESPPTGIPIKIKIKNSDDGYEIILPDELKINFTNIPNLQIVLKSPPQAEIKPEDLNDNIFGMKAKIDPKSGEVIVDYPGRDR